MEGITRRSLVYVTRDYEPKEDLSRNGVTLIQRRWSDFYRFLSGRNSRCDTIQNLLSFMKEHGMSQSNRITSIDLIALTNYDRARSLIEQTLGESIETRLRKMTPGPGWSASDRHTLNEGKQYTRRGFAVSDFIEFELGYWFPDEQPCDSPEVGMWISVTPNAPELSSISKAFREFSDSRKRGKEWTHKYPEGGECEGIWRNKKLEEFLAADDHVVEIVKWFHELLDDAEALRQFIPNLPWVIR
jgi:hypothetical protein